MEDASKEFQIFLSPTRELQQTHRDKTTTKHRLVPVINKMLSTSSSTFTLNQRKSSVYKAVSGVSFQDTDVSGKKGSKKEKREKKNERRQSYASYIADNDKKQGVPIASGARRSRSLTSMESGISGGSIDINTNNVPEITHPFAPTAIYNNSSGRRSRYTKVKEKRRSSSHARNGIELKKHESSFNDSEQQPPIRPRRARSASRSRKPLALVSFSSENNLDIPTLARDDLFHLRCETHTQKQTKNDNEHSQATKPHHDSLSSTNKQRTNESSGDIDFSVNDTDWRKYDVLVTEKLDTLLKKKEEPEGGYFSLEREEQDEIERFSEHGDQFQRDNCSETIYVAQVFEKDSKENNLPKYEQYTVEEIYSEVPFSNQGQEVGFVDDEGLYEEIFFDRSNENSATAYNDDGYGNTSPVNILVSPNLEPAHNTSKTLVEVERPKIEKSSSTTIVYISGDNHKHKNSTFYAPTPTTSSNFLKQSASCSNLMLNSDVKVNNKTKKLSVVDISNDRPVPSERIQGNNSAWCGCYNRLNSMENHSLSCIKSKPEFKNSKYSAIGNTQEECSSGFKVHASSEIHFPPRITSVLPATSVDTTSESSSYSQCDNIPEPDYELSDIDLDMFAPKHRNSSRTHNLSQTSKLGSVSDMHLNLPPRQPLNSFQSKNNSKKDNKEIISPQTFRGFLEDSIFNPPDTESLADDTEDLVLEDNQVVTCITDTSSSDESSTDEGDPTSEQKSPWLEAKNEFEFVAFKEGKSKASKFVRRKKPRKMISIPKIFGSPLVSTRTTSLDNPLNSTHLNNSYTESKEVPQRPTRRRKTSETSKLEATN